MKLTRAQWAALIIHNPYTLAKAGAAPQVFLVWFSRQHLGGNAWHVHRIGYQTNPEPGSWYDYGNKTFTAFGTGLPAVKAKALALESAQAWASERYGITEWERSPFGSWHPAGTMESARKNKGG